MGFPSPLAYMLINDTTDGAHLQLLRRLRAPYLLFPDDLSALVSKTNLVFENIEASWGHLRNLLCWLS